MTRRSIEVCRSPDGYGFRLRNERPCFIDYVINGSTAEKSGVKAGDILLKVNGVDVVDVTHEKVASMVWRSRTKLLIEVMSKKPECIPCSISPCRSSPRNSHGMITSKQKAMQTYGTPASVLVYAGCVSVATNFKSYTKNLSILRKKVNSVVNKIPVNSSSICLIDIFSDVLQVRLYNNYTAKYPLSCLYAAGLVDSDEKFFYVLTRKNIRNNIESTMRITENDRGIGPAKPMNCHVFRTLPSKFLSHSGHATIAVTFGINCSNDRLTGECYNFPSSTGGILLYLHNLLGISGLQDVMNSGNPQSCKDPCSRSRQSAEIYSVSPEVSSVGFQIKTDSNEHLPKISCFSSTNENEDVENIEPSNNVSNLSNMPSDPKSWAKDFDNLLSDPVGCSEFKKFLITEFSSENLDFFLSVRIWRRSFGTGNAKAKANEIFNQFLIHDAPQAVNIDHSAVKSASSYLLHPHIDMFLEAENQVYMLMKTDSFPRFLESSSYSSLLSNFNVNKSSRKSTSLNRPKFLKNKSNISVNGIPSNVTATGSRTGIPECELASAQSKKSTCITPQLNKSKSTVVNGSDTDVLPSFEINDKLSSEFNTKCFKSNLIRLKRMGIFLTVSASSTGYIPSRSEVIPPLKGSFPLDHRGICKAAMVEWTQCMMKNHWNSSLCRSEAAGYLRCRAENNLMDLDEITLLGFTEEEWNKTKQSFESKI
ncbi:Regulator of G-protein signaling 8 [Schistosoma japonicum]|uniref:Regulator of G-protein signaling 8 n=2 Tax=Schistosoma japonicum TaxID=6182 RepID=A0A4Z2DQJ1_SCHJA|nr:Regulator of G-protein signaling 8 [Schistosoma japonicum]